MSDNVHALPNPKAWRDPCPARGVTSRRVAVEGPQAPEPVKHELYEVALLPVVPGGDPCHDTASVTHRPTLRP